MQRNLDEADPEAIEFLRGNSSVVASALEENLVVEEEEAEVDQQIRPGSAGSAGAA